MSILIESLSKEMQPLAKLFVEKLHAACFTFVILETCRAMTTQIAYYAQGRESLTTVNIKRNNAGLYKIKETDNIIITRTLKSKHLLGEAIDVAPISPAGNIWWVAPDIVWETMGCIGESVGLDWGGRWDAMPGKLGWDCPHFERRL